MTDGKRPGFYLNPRRCFLCYDFGDEDALNYYCGTYYHRISRVIMRPHYVRESGDVPDDDLPH